jgi:hypothetical protein
MPVDGKRGCMVNSALTLPLKLRPDANGLFQSFR